AFVRLFRCASRKPDSELAISKLGWSVGEGKPVACHAECPGNSPGPGGADRVDRERTGTRTLSGASQTAARCLLLRDGDSPGRARGRAKRRTTRRAKRRAKRRT